MRRNSKLVVLGKFDIPFGWKINSILHVFLKILQKYCKLMILATLDIPGYTEPKWYYQLVENFCVYLHAKNQLHPPRFSEDIAKICKLLIFGILGIPGYAHPKWYYQLVENFDVYLGAKKLHHPLLSWDITEFLQFDWPTAF